MGLFCFAVPLLLLGVWLLVPRRHEQSPDDADKPRANSARRPIGIALLIAGVLAALMFEPHFKPERYLKTIEEHAAPLVVAIDAFDARHGVPPDRLEQLVPEYLESIPSTGCAGYGRFHYEYVSGLTQPRYKLTVPTGGWNVEEDPGFYFDSWSRRWGYSAR